MTTARSIIIIIIIIIVVILAVLLLLLSAHEVALSVKKVVDSWFKLCEQ